METDSTLQMDLAPETTLQDGKYRILKVLGQGGFGITYLAEHSVLGKRVAIKEFFPKDYCSREADTQHVTLGTQSNRELIDKLRTRFLREASNLSKLSHPGIVQIHDIFRENDTAYYVMDYVEGQPLSELVKLNGPLPLPRVVEYISKIADALSYVHSHRITHFDLKPANVMLRASDNRPVLIDFGLSKQFGKDGSAESSMLIGISHGYSPIEQYTAGSIVSFSPQTDIYALGATLYNLLTGCTPPEAASLIDSPLNLPPFISGPPEAAIRAAMRPGRADRCQSVEEFMAILNNNAHKAPPFRQPLKNESTRVLPPGGGQPPLPPGLGQPPMPPSTMPGQPMVSIPEEKKKSHAWLWALIGVAIALLIFLIAVLASDDSSDSAYVDNSETSSEQIDDYAAPTAGTSTPMPAAEASETQQEQTKSEEEASGNSDYASSGLNAVANTPSSPRNGQLAHYFNGNFIDSKGGRWPIKICFIERGDGTMNAIYNNVSQGGIKINMDVSSSGNTVYLTGKDGKNDFSITLEANGSGTWSGITKTGNSRLDVEVSPGGSSF